MSPQSVNGRGRGFAQSVPHSFPGTVDFLKFSSLLAFNGKIKVE